MYEAALWVIGGLILIGILTRYAIFLFTISLAFLIIGMFLHDYNAVVTSGVLCIIFGAIAGGQQNVNVWN